MDTVAAGSRLVGDATQAMSELDGTVQRVSDTVGEITLAASEQSDGIGHIHQAVSQLDPITRHTAALVEESAQAAQRLQDTVTRPSAAVGRCSLAAG